MSAADRRRGPTRRAVIAWAGVGAAAAALAPGFAAAEPRPRARPPVTEADPVFAEGVFADGVFAEDVAHEAAPAPGGSR